MREKRGNSCSFSFTFWLCPLDPPALAHSLTLATANPFFSLSLPSNRETEIVHTRIHVVHTHTQSGLQCYTAWNGRTPIFFLMLQC